MDEFLLQVLLRLVVTIVTIAIAVAAWLAAEQVAQLDPPVEGERRAIWAEVLGWGLTCLGALCLVSALGVGVVMIITQQGVLTPYLATPLVAVLTAMSLLIAYRAARTIPDALEEAAAALREAPEGSARLDHFRRRALQPVRLLLGGILIAALASAVIPVLSATWLNGLPGESDSLAVPLLAIVGMLFLFTGLCFVTTTHVLRWPANVLASDQPRFLSWSLTLLSILFALFSAVSMSWLGLVAVALYVIFIASTLGGRKQASQLGAFWTLANAVRSGRPLETELRQQADSATGRTRQMLLTAGEQLEAGDPLADVLYRSGLMPSGARLEIGAANVSGALAEALAAAAARETVRFARQNDPCVPRLALGYLGAVGFALVNVAGFIGYYIIPKFKKIFEDFNVELPETTVQVISVIDSPWMPVVWVVGSLSFLTVGIVGELAVDYYGWQGVVELIGGRWGRRHRTPDLLRGLRWAVARKLPLDAALDAMQAAPIGFQQRSRLHQALVGIRQGRDPWEALRASGWLNRQEEELLQSAQAAGNLPWTLETLADAIVSRNEYRLEWWLQVLHPAFVIVAGMLVGYFTCAMFLPLFSLIDMAS